MFYFINTRFLIEDAASIVISTLFVTVEMLTNGNFCSFMMEGGTAFAKA
ncbi:hypothetical protein [uncultured Dokdonia sp.]|nr:hypothetical protein [uncultured Dokdonia sp.]